MMPPVFYNLFLAQQEAGFWMPEQASTAAPSTDFNFWMIFWISTFFFVLIMAVMFLFIWKYRARPGHKEQHTAHHNTTLEVTWTVIPLILVFFMFAFGFSGYMNKTVAPKNAIEVQVSSFQWGWEFKYLPTGATDNILYAPVNTPVELLMSSTDVIHSLYIPAFRVKKDCVPGRINTLWFEATRTGEFDLYCTEYCGTQHSTMITKVVVLEELEYIEKMKEINISVVEKVSPVEAGAILYEKKACNQCHSVDGSSGIGPTFKNLWGSKHSFADGSSFPITYEDGTVSEAVDLKYIEEAIRYPAKRIVAGYPNQMSNQYSGMPQKEIIALEYWMRTLSDKYDGPDVTTLGTGQLLDEHKDQVEPGAAGQDDAAGPQDTTQ